MKTNIPAMKTDSAVRPVLVPCVWYDSSGVVREAVQVETVIPVGAPDERQAMRPEVVDHVIERALQVLEECRRSSGSLSKGTFSRGMP